MVQYCTKSQSSPCQSPIGGSEIPLSFYYVGRTSLRLSKGVWLCCLNNNFSYLNNTTQISITFFHSHIFSQHLNNVIKTILPKRVLNLEMCVAYDRGPSLN